MYYANFKQYVESKTKQYNVSVKDEGEFCRVIPGESMSVGSLRQLFTTLDTVEDINVRMDSPLYLTVEHHI
jgi:hypothetical protein